MTSVSIAPKISNPSPWMETNPILATSEKWIGAQRVLFERRFGESISTLLPKLLAPIYFKGVGPNEDLLRFASNPERVKTLINSIRGNIEFSQFDPQAPMSQLSSRLVGLTVGPACALLPARHLNDSKYAYAIRVPEDSFLLVIAGPKAWKVGASKATEATQNPLLFTTDGRLPPKITSIKDYVGDVELVKVHPGKNHVIGTTRNILTSAFGF